MVSDNFLSRANEFVAFRVSSQDQHFLQSRWENILVERDRLDEYILHEIPGIEVLLSAITAHSKLRSVDGDEKERVIYPGLAYWIVLRAGFRDIRLLNDKMQKGPFSGTLKILLQPHQTSAKEISNAFLIVLKDTMTGCVPHLVNRSIQHCLNVASTSLSATASNAKVFSKEEHYEALTAAGQALGRYKLSIHLCQI